MHKLSDKQIKEGWQIVKFGEIAKNISERVNPSETDLKVYVGLEHLDPQSLRIMRKGVPSDVKGQKLRVRPGQIIFGKRRAYQKKLAIADFDGICSAHAMVLEEKVGKVISGLLPFFMQSDIFMDRAVAISEGSLSPTIKWKTLANQKFSLPPVERQKEILEVLEKVEEIILKIENLICSGELLFKIILQKKINNPKQKEKFFPITDLSKIVNSPVDKKTKKGQDSIKLCNYVDVYNNREITNDLRFMKASASQSEIQKFSLRKGDVVITKDSETPYDIGISTYIAEDIDDLVCGYHLAIIRSNSSVSGKYLSYALCSPKVRHGFVPYAQGITRFGLSSDTYKNVKIFCPSIAEQKKIVNVLDSLQKCLAFMKKQSVKYTNIKKIILKELLLNF